MYLIFCIIFCAVVLLLLSCCFMLLDNLPFLIIAPIILGLSVWIFGRLD